jgi:hypothetical protein
LREREERHRGKGRKGTERGTLRGEVVGDEEVMM